MVSIYSLHLKYVPNVTYKAHKVAFANDGSTGTSNRAIAAKILIMWNVEACRSAQESLLKVAQLNLTRLGKSLTGGVTL
jgi:hypothetical protein